MGCSCLRDKKYKNILRKLDRMKKSFSGNIWWMLSFTTNSKEYQNDAYYTETFGTLTSA